MDVRNQGPGAPSGTGSTRSAPEDPQGLRPPGDDPSRSMVKDIARIVDDDAWRALEDGRDGPDALWAIRRELALNKAEAIIRALAKPTAEMASAGINRLYEMPADPSWVTLTREVCAVFQAMLAAALDRDSDTRRMAETGTGSERSSGSAGPKGIAQTAPGDHP